MRRWATIGCLLLSLTSPVLADTPTSGGTVSIPLSEFMRLTHPIQTTQSTAPMPFILSRGDYRLTEDNQWMQVDANLSLRLYATGMVEVPLMSSDVALADASLDGKPLPLYQKEAKFYFIASGAGMHSVRIRYHLPVTSSGATRSLVLTLPATSVSSTRVSLPDKVRVTSSPSVPLDVVARKGKTVVDASLPASDNAVTLSWTPEQADPLLHGRQHHEKPVLQAHSSTLVTVSDKVVRTHARFYCTILRNETSGLTFQVPAGQEVVDVQGPHLTSWNASPATPGVATRDVTLSFSEPVSGDECIDLTLEQSLDSVNSTWEVPTVALVGAVRVKGSIGIETTGGIDVSLADQSDIRGIDVKELPQDVTSMATSPVVLAYEYHKQPFHLALASQKGEELPVLTATIDTAQGLTLVTAEGKTVTRICYTVRNNLKQNLTLRLPQGATLWSASVNGEPVKPIKTNDGAIKVPLLRSQGTSDGMSTFPAEVTYVSDGTVPTLWGERTMAAPECDVPISQFNWSVYLPRNAHVWRLGGTMELSTEPVAMGIGGGAAGPASAPQAASVPAARPEANTRSAGGAQSELKQLASGELGKDAEEDDKVLSGMTNTARVGALPVQVYVPEVGQAYHFTSLMVARQMPTVEVYYSSGRAEAAVAGIVFTGFLLGGTLLARRVHAGARLSAMFHRLRPVEPTPSGA